MIMFDDWPFQVRQMTAHMAYLGRIKLRPAGYRQMEAIRRALNWLYNQALENRKTAYEQRKETLTFFDQCKWLTKLRTEEPESLVSEIAVTASRGMLKRIDCAFKAFFRRVKSGEAPGYPRFRPLSRCRTIDVCDPRTAMIRRHNGYYLIRVKGFPRLRVDTTRLLPLDAPLKVLSFTNRGRHWQVSMVFAVEKKPLGSSASSVGIDMGVRKRMVCSDGTISDRARREWSRKRKLQRAISRSRKGSGVRRKRVAALRRFERKQYVMERNVCHRATTNLVRKHGLIAVEALKIDNMTRSAKGTKESPGSNVKAKAGLNREILSQNWSLLRSQLRYKAEWAGREYVEVNPAYTSQDCSRCGARHDPGSSEVYRCPTCGFEVDRDLNAAINILAAVATPPDR